MLDWLPTVLRDAGLEVDVLPGWSQRGSRGRGVVPRGIVCHHTVTGTNWPDHRVDHLLRDGHSTLAGPLSQLGLRRDGSFIVVAAGRCNHNGYGTWGNDTIGIEAYNDGKGEPWGDAQMDAYVRGVAALCRHLGWGTDRVLGHKETDPKRKTDPTFDMHAFRARVDALLSEEDEVKPEDIEAIADAVEQRLRDEFMTAAAAVQEHVTDTAAETRSHIDQVAAEINKQAKKFRDNLAELVRRVLHGGDDHDADEAFRKRLDDALGPK